MRLTKFGSWAIVTALNLAGMGTWLVAQAQPQGGVSSGAWSSHNYDARNSRFSPLDEINVSNVNGLTEQWTVEMGASDAISYLTPLVVDGVMYFNAGSHVFAVDGATGKSLWTRHVEPPFPGGAGRGPTG